MNRKTLRPYQARLVTDVCRASGDVLVEQPTGSGKTMQIVTLVAMQLGRRFTHAVISAPQEQIEHGFGPQCVPSSPVGDGEGRNVNLDICTKVVYRGACKGEGPMAKRSKAGRLKKGKMPRASISLPANIREELERIAERRKVSVAWVIREAVDRYLASENPLFHRVQ